MKKKVLLIGGTGTISAAVARLLSQSPDWELYLLNRGSGVPEGAEGVKLLKAEIHDEKTVSELIAGIRFDTVADFISFVPAQLESRYRLFGGKTRQYIFISSASAYQKPLSDYRITESTPLCNPYWQYSRDKIACEEYLLKLYREEAFPVTIVRPSHTYDERSVPLGVHGANGSWQVIARMLAGKPVIIHGDGTSLWTMTHNSDFAKGFAGLMGNPKAIGESVHITSDESLSWNQIYAAIAAAAGAELKPCYAPSALLAKLAPQYDFTGSLIGDKANSVVFDNSKLKRLVPGFAATVRFDEGIRRTICNVMAKKELQTADPEFDAFCDRVVAVMESATRRGSACHRGSLPTGCRDGVPAGVPEQKIKGEKS